MFSPSRQGHINPFQRDACMFCQFSTQPSPRQAFGRAAKPVHTSSSTQTRRVASTATAATQSSTTEASEPSMPGAPDITNHYTIFAKTLPAGPPPASPFEISVRDLRNEFLQLQAIAHPDKYPSGEAKQKAEALSARINEAYRTLSDPLHRAQYLLREYHGIDVTAEDGAKKHELDPATLMEVIEVQEAIEEAGTAEEIEALKKENEMRIARGVEDLSSAFDRGDVEGARKESVKLRFWYSVGDGLREK